jgi:predicted enzyme related to lactoylglutathione lyase
VHKSRLGAIVIDCRTEDAEAAAAFWGAALGYETKVAGDPRYIDLVVPEDQPAMIVQKVDHESRIHLDIETDDVEAEVTRLEALGAKRVAQIKSWWVMQAPTGQKFCVIKPQRKDFEAGSAVRQG